MELEVVVAPSLDGPRAAPPKLKMALLPKLKLPLSLELIVVPPPLLPLLLLPPGVVPPAAVAVPIPKRGFAPPRPCVIVEEAEGAAD